MKSVTAAKPDSPRYLVLAACLLLAGASAASAQCDEFQLLGSDTDAVDEFGAAVAIDGDLAVVAAPGKDAIYIFNRGDGQDPWPEVARIDVGLVGVGSYVAISADTLIVGAAAGVSGGTVSVFQRDHGGPGAWGLVVELTPLGQTPFDFGSSVAIQGDTAIVGSKGAAHIFERHQGETDNWGQVRKLNASDAGSSDWFGLAVSISGDTAIVGASRFDAQYANGTGSAYVFERNHGGPNNWGEVVKLVAPDANTNHFFGSAVSVDGDAALVAADGADTLRGAAYVFQRDSAGPGDWGLIKRLVPADVLSGSVGRFGSAVSISGDNAIVAAFADDDGGPNAGALYIFRRHLGGPGNWGGASKIIHTGFVDQFGLSADLDGDTALVGARWEDAVGSNSGAAYVYTGLPDYDCNGNGVCDTLDIAAGTAEDCNGNTVPDECDVAIAATRDCNDNGIFDECDLIAGTSTDANGNGVPDECEGFSFPCGVTTLLASDAVPTDGFGGAVALSGDTAIVGASSVEPAGAAYIFARDPQQPDRWQQVIKLFPPGGAPLDRFGASVAIDGGTAIVGARAEQPAGAAYVFQRNEGGPDNWGQVAALTVPLDPNDAFGVAVAIFADIAVVGAWGDDDADPADPFCDSGAAYVFARNQGGPEAWGLVVKVTPSNPECSGFFGAITSLDGDTLVVSGFSFTSSTYVFQRDHGGSDQWGEVRVLIVTGLGSLSLNGDMLLAGAPFDNQGINAGLALLFARDQGGPNNWGQVAVLAATDTAPGDNFGRAVALDGDIALVGAPRTDDPLPVSGSLYVFHRNEFGPDTWGQTAEGNAFAAAENLEFGGVVELEGTTTMLGLPRAGDLGPNAGAVWVFDVYACAICAGDVDGDGVVGVTDLLGLLAAWGTNPGGPPDFDGDGVVAVPDLLTLLSAWGPCQPAPPFP